MDGTCNAMETCPITTYCYIATIGCYILLQCYDMLCHRGACYKRAMPEETLAIWGYGPKSGIADVDSQK